MRRPGSQTASRTWAFRHQGHGGQSASKSCSSYSAGGRQTHALYGLPGSARMLSWKGHGTWSGPADGHFLLETPLEGGACQRYIVSGCLFEGGCNSDLENCISSGTSWKCVSFGSKTNASRIVVQVLWTSRGTHDRPLKDAFKNGCFENGWLRKT